MTYTVTKTDGTVYASIGEGVVDNTLGISLIGQNLANYGQLIANNFVYLLENQASDSEPANPIEGQLWWNTETKVLSVFDGNRFKPSSSSAVSDSIPTNPLAGDQWWDKNENRLKIYTGTDWVAIGPTYTKNQGFGGWNPNSVTDSSGNSHIVLELKSDNEIVAIVNNGAGFQLSTAINGITVVGKGLTLASNMTLTGTALNALQLGGVVASEYPTKSAALNTFTGNLTVNGTVGITAAKITSTDSAVLNNPALTGVPVATIPDISDDSNRVATTSFVKDAIGATGNVLDSPSLTGTPTASEPNVNDDSARIATTSYVRDVFGLSGSIGFSGYSGVSGYSGSAAVAGAVVHTQSVPATTWNIAHNLGYRHVNVEVINSSNESMVGSYDYPEILFNDDNNVIITFASATAGYAAITSGGGGTPGASGYSGRSGYSGVGSPGTSGYSGVSGAAPASAAVPVTFQLAGTTTHTFQADAVYTTGATGATTWTITGLPSSGTVAYWTVEITNGLAGTQSWYANTKWDGGTIPTLTAGTDILTFYTHNGGTTIRGFLAASNSS